MFATIQSISFTFPWCFFPCSPSQSVASMSLRSQILRCGLILSDVNKRNWLSSELPKITDSPDFWHYSRRSIKNVFLNLLNLSISARKTQQRSVHADLSVSMKSSIFVKSILDGNVECSAAFHTVHKIAPSFGDSFLQ